MRRRPSMRGDSEKLKRFNMVVVPSAGRSLYNIVVSYHFLYAAAAVLAVVLCLNALLLTGYIGARGRTGAFGAANAEESVEELNRKAEELSVELEQVKEIGQRIQDKTGISVEPDMTERSSEEGYDGLSSRWSGADGADYAALRMRELDAEVESRKQALLTAERRIEKKLEKFAGVPSISPVRNGEVSSGFGYRVHPITGSWEFHEGIDIRGEYTTPIYATADGVVEFSDWRHGYGKAVGIDHENGYFTMYAHNSRNLVREGERVRKGQIIAYVGGTGSTTGTHVHYEVHFDGRLQNPVKFLRVDPRDLDKF